MLSVGELEKIDIKNCTIDECIFLWCDPIAWLSELSRDKEWIELGIKELSLILV